MKKLYGGKKTASYLFRIPLAFTLRLLYYL
jgi:hypothetical protein